MKVYVSEKDIEENDLNFIEDEFVEKYWLVKGDGDDDVGFEVYGDVGMVEIETLEQHDAEIRKPLEDEIDREIQKYKDKIKELELYKKALELSIKKSVGLMGYGTVEIDRQAEIKWKEQFVEKARKELEDERS